MNSFEYQESSRLTCLQGKCKMIYAWRLNGRLKLQWIKNCRPRDTKLSISASVHVSTFAVHIDFDLQALIFHSILIIKHDALALRPAQFSLQCVPECGCMWLESLGPLKCFLPGEGRCGLAAGEVRYDLCLSGDMHPCDWHVICTEWYNKSSRPLNVALQIRQRAAG